MVNLRSAVTHCSTVDTPWRRTPQSCPVCNFNEGRRTLRHSRKRDQEVEHMYSVLARGLRSALNAHTRLIDDLTSSYHVVTESFASKLLRFLICALCSARCVLYDDSTELRPIDVPKNDEQRAGLAPCSNSTTSPTLRRAKMARRTLASTKVWHRRISLSEQVGHLYHDNNDLVINVCMIRCKSRGLCNSRSL